MLQVFLYFNTSRTLITFFFLFFLVLDHFVFNGNIISHELLKHSKIELILKTSKSLIDTFKLLSYIPKYITEKVNTIVVLSGVSTSGNLNDIIIIIIVSLGSCVTTRDWREWREKRGLREGRQKFRSSRSMTRRSGEIFFRSRSFNEIKWTMKLV